MFQLCKSKTCVDTVDCCQNLIPYMCGGKRIPTMVDIPCGNIYFTGITDMTVAQFSESIDLAEGIHAYDGTGREIAFTYSPTSIDTSVLGEHIVTYTASGIGDSIKPIMCGKMALHTTECDYSTVKAYRKITVVETYGVVCQSGACESLVGCAN